MSWFKNNRKLKYKRKKELQDSREGLSREKDNSVLVIGLYN